MLGEGWRAADAQLHDAALMNNHGNYACRWAMCAAGWPNRPKHWASKSIPALPAPTWSIGEDGSVKGVVAGVFGIGKDGTPGDDYQPGMELHGKYVMIGEGVRGSLPRC
jgi:electron-transferring-flavoprotein dehydrogenase